MPGYLANDPAAKDALYLGFRDQTGKSVEMVSDLGPRSDARYVTLNEMQVIGCEGPAEKERWLGATSRDESLQRPSPPPRRRHPAILKAIKAYSPSLPDELMLNPGDIISLSRNPGNGV
jgi:hypothetical protein